MAAPVYQMNFEQDIAFPITVRHGGTIMFTGDNLADTISVSILENGSAHAISGTVTMNCIRPDGATVAVTGSVSGNTASATLTQACVAIPGPLAVVMKISSDSTTTTLLKVIYTVDIGVTGTAVDPGTIIPDINALISAIETAIGSIPADYSELLAAIAPSFNPEASTPYPAGSYVWYPGLSNDPGALYKFTDDHSGSWTGSDVEGVVFGNEIADLKSATVKKDGIGEVTAQNLQITDVVYSKNLWNPDTVTDGIWINPANGNEASGNYETTDYIPVEAGEKYYGTWQLGPTEGNRGDMTLNFVTCYDSSKAVMSSSGMTGPSNPITIPVGCSFVRISNSNNTYYKKRQFEKGTTATSYQDYGIVSAKIKDTYMPSAVVESVGVTSAIKTATENDVGKALSPKTVENGKVTEWQYKDFSDDGTETTFNMFDFSAWTDGYIKSDGTLTGSTPATASSIYATSDFIPAAKGDVFVCSAKSQFSAIGIGVQIGYFAEYDSNKSLLRYTDSNQGSAPVQNASAAYVRITVRIGTYGTNLKIEKNAYGLFTSYRDNTVYKGLAKPSHIFIPKFIYVAVGRTIEIYNDQIVLETEGYHIQYICQYGTAMNRKFTLTGTSTMASGRSDSSLSYGQYRLFVNIYNNENQLVWQGASLIWVKAAISSAKTVIPIGDSLTNWKKWLPECIRLSSNNLTFVGTRYSGLDQDSAGNTYASGTIHHEGRSGWSAASYLANTSYTFDDRYDGVAGVSGSANPFWDGTAFSLEHYLTTQEKDTPTAVQIFLGTNDIADGIETAVENIVAIVESIRAEYSTLKILVVNTIYRSDQDGYGSIGSEGYAGGNNGANAYAYNEDIKVMDLANKLTMALIGMSNVYVVPLYCSHDTEYNFGWEEYHPNPRATQIVHIPAESVHPAIQGYWQFADVLFSAYSVLL